MEIGHATNELLKALAWSSGDVWQPISRALISMGIVRAAAWCIAFVPCA